MLGPNTKWDIWATKSELVQLPYGKTLHVPQSALFYHPSTLSRAPDERNFLCQKLFQHPAVPGSNGEQLISMQC